MRTNTQGQQALPETVPDVPHQTFPEAYAHRWQMVKSVPEDPHEYVVRRNLDTAGKEAYDAFIRAIRQFGERRLWKWKETTRPKAYWYLRQDGYEFWEAPAGLVNRKPIGQRRKVATCPECGAVGVLTEVGKVLVPHQGADGVTSPTWPDCDYHGAAILTDPED